MNNTNTTQQLDGYITSNETFIAFIKTDLSKTSLKLLFESNGKWSKYDPIDFIENYVEPSSFSAITCFSGGIEAGSPVLIYFFDLAGNLQEISWIPESNTWSQVNVTKKSGLPVAFAYTELLGFTVGTIDKEYCSFLYYIDLVDEFTHRLIEVKCIGDSWEYSNITPKESWAQPFMESSLQGWWSQNNVIQLFYLSSGNIVKLSYDNNTWTPADITKTINANTSEVLGGIDGTTILLDIALNWTPTLFTFDRNGPTFPQLQKIVDSNGNWSHSNLNNAITAINSKISMPREPSADLNFPIAAVTSGNSFLEIYYQSLFFVGADNTVNCLNILESSSPSELFPVSTGIKYPSTTGSPLALGRTISSESAENITNNLFYISDSNDLHTISQNMNQFLNSSTFSETNVSKLATKVKS